jgi:3-oxoacyl-[acyl-carrier protein] reductase
MNKTILITGATGEIGKSLAHFFSKQPIRLILAARDISKLNGLKEELMNPAADIILSPFNYNDVTSYSLIHSLIENQLDGCILITPKIAQTKQCLPSKEEWLETLTNVFIDPLEFFKSLIPLLTLKGSSKVVVLSGISSKILLSNYASNGAIRAAWQAQVKAMAFEYGKLGLHINTLSLGGVMTDSFIHKTKKESIQRNLSFEDVMKEKTSNVPLNKYASLTEVCSAVDGLLSHFSDHMTGQNFICDGGFIRCY